MTALALLWRTLAGSDGSAVALLDKMALRAGVCETAGADAAERLRADTDVTRSLVYESAACDIAT
jgi:hypothetical protein